MLECLGIYYTNRNYYINRTKQTLMYNEKPRSFNKSSMYEIKCNDLNGKQFGQNGGAIKTCHGEHLAHVQYTVGVKNQMWP